MVSQSPVDVIPEQNPRVTLNNGRCGPQVNKNVVLQKCNFHWLFGREVTLRVWRLTSITHGLWACQLWLWGPSDSTAGRALGLQVSEQVLIPELHMVPQALSLSGVILQCRASVNLDLCRESPQVQLCKKYIKNTKQRISTQVDTERFEETWGPRDSVVALSFSITHAASPFS